MKPFALIIFVTFLFACSEQLSEVPPAGLSDHKMKIIPVNPTGNDDIKLVVFDDCTYNTLSGITKKDHAVDIEKHYNSMMKWPCMVANDTITIGKLTSGTYRINYKLVDLATSFPEPVFSFSFNLVVSR